MCSNSAGSILTSNAGEKLPRKALNLTARKGHELVALEEVENALPKKVGNNTYVVPEIEAVP